jgi:hypothetical protein
MSLSISNFKCLDFDYLKDNLKFNLIPDLIDIILFYLEPINYNDKHLYLIGKVEDARTIENSEGLNYNKEHICQNIISITKLIMFTGYIKKFYCIAKFRNNSNIKYILLLSLDNNLYYYLRTNIYEILKITTLWTDIDIDIILDLFYGSYFI